jgi:putative nucleotidyltransferase with HDIG domain
MSIPLPFRVPTRSAAILLVDENPLAHGVSLQRLFQAGCRIDLAVTPCEAMDFLQRRSYSLVLCHYGTTAEAGVDLLRHLSQVQPDVPSLFFSRTPGASGVAELLGPDGGLMGHEGSSPLITGLVLQETLSALVAAIDSRDPHNGRHSHRVASLALYLGRELGLPGEQLEMLELAALLHDVGKLGVPRRILAKPGPLDDTEWTVMRQHPVYGAEIVVQVGLLSDVATIIRHHHERIDGNGYPDGIAGEQIPLLARLICIVDAYEAMTADRSYREAMDTRKARSLMEESLGSQFDPCIGEVFLRMNEARLRQALDSSLPA